MRNLQPGWGRPRPRVAGRQGPLVGFLAGLLAGMALLGEPLRAQTQDVPQPDLQGNFAAGQASGDRGAVPQRFWLVVDRDPRGLLCRDGQGRPSIALKYGAMVEALAPLAGAPPLPTGTWLRVRVKPVAVLYDARLRGRGSEAICQVRAHSVYLAPVNADSLQQVLQPSP
jgi:hypothetical protein